MSPVDGSRHYGGPGLGEVGIWRCPACGAENAGELTLGCQACGSGAPGQHHATPPPAPPTSAPEELPEEGPEHLGAFDRWALHHQHATLEQAFIAGYIEGMRDARRGIRSTQPQSGETFRPEGIVNRTIIAALELFRDQVLSGARAEIESGEWLSIDAVNELLAQLRTHELHAEEAHV